MKKILLLVLLASAIALTGCGKSNKQLVCSIEKSLDNVTVNGNIIADLDGEDVTSVRVEMMALLDDEYFDQAKKIFDDKISNIVKENVEDDKINIYFFHGNGCSHCANEEKFLKSLKREYGDYFNLYSYETWTDMTNEKLMKKAKEKMGENIDTSVPFTVIGNESYVGYSDSIGEEIEARIKQYILFSDKDSLMKAIKDKLEEYLEEQFRKANPRITSRVERNKIVFNADLSVPEGFPDWGTKSDFINSNSQFKCKEQ